MPSGFDPYHHWLGIPPEEQPLHHYRLLGIRVFEDNDDLVVKVELPGMEKDNIKVDLNDDVLTISGEKEKKEKIAEKDYHQEERSHGSFRRSLRLPVKVQMDEVKATFTSGVLEVRLPMTEQAKTEAKEISIQ